jgi:hypothetical protein
LAFFSKAYVKVLAADFFNPSLAIFSLQQFSFSNSFPFQKLPTPKSQSPKKPPKQKPKVKAKASSPPFYKQWQKGWSRGSWGRA